MSRAVYREATFKAATRGLSAYRIALALNRLSPRGTDWRGCKKSELAEEFADGRLAGITGAELRSVIAKELSR